MKILGIDYGTRRVGFALGEVGSSLVLPLGSAEVADDDEAVEAVLQRITAEGAGELVIGLPVALTGETGGEMAQKVFSFLAKLKQKISIPISAEDERLTTAYVERLRQEAGVVKEQFDKDAAAAVAILESHLARKK